MRCVPVSTDLGSRDPDPLNYSYEICKRLQKPQQILRVSILQNANMNGSPRHPDKKPNNFYHHLWWTGLVFGLKSRQNTACFPIFLKDLALIRTITTLPLVRLVVNYLTDIPSLEMHLALKYIYFTISRTHNFEYLR